MELTVTQQERPWDRPFWKPVHGKEGVFAYLVLIHSLSVVGLTSSRCRASKLWA